MSHYEVLVSHRKETCMENDRKHFKLNVPSELMEKLKSVALRESRSVTAQINLMLRKQVEAEEAEQK